MSLQIELLKDAIDVAQGEGVFDWESVGAGIERRMQMLDAQIKSKPVVPVELSNEYREEVDSLTLENIQLSGKLDQTKDALGRAKNAYMEETNYSKILLGKLEQLENRLVSVMSNGL